MSANFHWLSERGWNNVISPWNFLESDRNFTLTSFDLCNRTVCGNKEKLWFNLAKHWSVKQTANTFSRSYESRSIDNILPRLWRPFIQWMYVDLSQSDHRGYEATRAVAKKMDKIRAWTGLEHMIVWLHRSCSTIWAIKPSGRWSPVSSYSIPQQMKVW